MPLFLGLLIFSFLTTSVAIIPFIDLLFRLHLTHPHHPKYGTPIGGGLLIISLVTFLYASMFPVLDRLGVYITASFPLKHELNIIFFTFISFGLLGLYDDLIKIFHLKEPSFFPGLIGLKTLVQLLLSVIVAALLYQNLRIDIINLPYLEVVRLGFFYIPTAALLIFSLTRSFDIADGMDGLACGSLVICLLAFWAISVTALDTVLSVFLALWIGSLIAFLYFNVYPARIWLGNSGSLAFGATLAVTGLLLGKIVGLMAISGLFLVIGVTYAANLAFTRLFHRPLFSPTPLHYWLESRGWPEPKVVMRSWLLAALFAVFGLWLAGI